MIEINSVSKKFGKKVVLKDVSLRINKGETFVIIGLSGAGKTSILRHIAGFYDPDSGDVLVDGTKMNGANNSVKQKLRKKMGFLFQFGALINWLSVRDNVGLPLVEHKLCSKDEVKSIVNEKLKLLQLLDSADKFPSDISGGMIKRTGLARAIVLNPQIILYDEPTSGLDPVMSSMINELIIKMKKELGITSVVVTHDMNSAYRIADKIAMLYNGEIIELGTPDDFKNTKNLIVRQFVNGQLEGPIGTN